MIAVGREPMCTWPLAAVTMVGKLPAPLAAALAVLLVVWELPHAAHVAARAAAAARAGRRRERTRMIILRRVVEDEVRPLRRPTGASKRTALPPRTVRRHRQASGLIPSRGHHRCGTAPESHRLRWVGAILGGPRTTGTLSRLEGARLSGPGGPGRPCHSRPLVTTRNRPGLNLSY